MNIFLAMAFLRLIGQIYNYSLISKNSKDFCDIIVKKSIEKGSMDNISCFVIKLN